MKPIEEALRRWWQWRYGYNTLVPPLKQMWLDINVFHENDGSLTYKQFIYDKLQEVADEQYDKLSKLENLPTQWREDTNDLDDDCSIDFNEGVKDTVERCADDIETILNPKHIKRNDCL
jgi:hypothetical protein